ncbi:sugar transferase [Patescibacteria group bacterium]|nr:sugar transferase [Patescibacteria group bacterium]MBU1963276.1 sugar transferase [Patescibacteria group bacterium]
MKKRAELFFGVVLLPIDFFMLILAGLTAYYLRFGETIADLRPVIYEMPWTSFMLSMMLVALIMILIFALAGLYNLRGTRRIIDEVKRIFLACSIGVLIIIVMTFFDRELFSSRFIILAAWLFAVVYVTLARMIVLYIQRALFSRGIGMHRVVMIGDGNTARIIEKEINQNKGLGMQIVEKCDSFTGPIQDKLAKIKKVKDFDEILQANPSLPKDESSRIIEFCNEHNVTYRFAAGLYEAQSSNVEMRALAGIPVIEIKRTQLEGWGKILKRLIDIIGSLFFIIIFSPFMIIAAIAIMADSKGPIIYRNERVGKNGKLFDTFKFRSMKAEFSTGKQFGNSEEAMKLEKELIEKQSIKEGPIYKIKDDPRVTKVGSFIRKTSIDEMPQFFNVLKGEMSIVGPRPHQPREVENYDKKHMQVFSVKPGITGMAQISGRSDLKFQEEIKLDTYYIENWSLWLDIYIMVKTPFAMVKSREAL